MQDYSDLSALFFNGTLKRSPSKSNTDGLIEACGRLMEKQGVKTEVIRTIDHDIATGVQPDMREHGWETDEWPHIFEEKSERILTRSGARIKRSFVWESYNYFT